MPKAIFPRKLTMGALVKLYAELSGKLLAPGADQEAIRRDIEHVAAVLKMLDRSYDPAAIPPIKRNRPNPHFRRHQAPAIIMQVLRGANRPMTTREIVIRVFAARGVIEPTWPEYRNMNAVVHFCLGKLTDRSVNKIRDGRLVWWSIRL